MPCSYSLLYIDFFELSLLLGASFLVNYVTADAKTNWVEGLIMVSFYFMIVCPLYPHQLVVELIFMHSFTVHLRVVLSWTA